MPSQLDAKIYSLTFKLFTSGVGIELGHFQKIDCTYHNQLYKYLVGGAEFQYSFEKSCLSHKLFVTLSSIAVLHQKGRHGVSRS